MAPTGGVGDRFTSCKYLKKFDFLILLTDTCNYYNDTLIYLVEVDLVKFIHLKI